MAGSIFGIAVSGLNAAKAALETTSHNIGNVNTQGYVRQTTTQKASDPMFEGYGFVGTGTNLTGVTRVFDQFTESQLRTVSAKVASLDTQTQALQDLDNLVADSSAGLSTVIQGFFNSLQTLNTQPASSAARQAVLSQAQALASRFGSVGNRVEELRQGLGVQANSAVDSINAYSGEIASLNKQIMLLQQGPGRLPNDLLDRRDSLVQQLNGLIKTEISVQDDGSYSIFVGQGQALVLGDQAAKMVVQRVNTDDPDTISIGISIPNMNEVIPIDPSRMGGGKLEGVMKVLQTDVQRIQTDLGRMAVEFSDAVNRQHKLGLDLSAMPGGNFFTDLSAERAQVEWDATAIPVQPQPSLEKQAFYMRQALEKFGVAITDPSKIAAASALTTTSTASKPAITSLWQVANAHQDIVDATPQQNDSNPLVGSAAFAALPMTMTYAAGSNLPTITGPAGFTFSAVTLSATQSGVYEFTVDNGTGDKVKLAFKAEGTPDTAATFTIGQQTNPNALNNANLLEMSRLQKKGLITPTPSGQTSLVTSHPRPPSTSTTNIQDFYGQMVSYVGNRASVAEISLTAQEASKQQVTLNREEISGVNLDEEAANLIRYQQAYQASSRVIQVAQDMFKNLLEIR